MLALVPAAALAVPHQGQPAPGFSLPRHGGGKNVALDQLRGNPVYVNFFASWCGPCNAEAPTIGRLRAKYAKQHLQVVGINELDTAPRAADFVRKNAATYSQVAFDEDGGVGRSYGAIVLPVHVFIDRRGVVTFFKIGEMDPGEIERAIKGALK